MELSIGEIVEFTIKQQNATLKGDNGTVLLWDNLNILYGGAWVVGRHQTRPKGFAVHYKGDDFSKALETFVGIEERARTNV